MKKFLFIVAMPFLVSIAFGWGAFPVVCGMFFLGVLISALLRAFGVKLFADSAWGYVPSGFGYSVNPSTGMPMVGATDVGGNTFGAGHRNG